MRLQRSVSSQWVNEDSMSWTFTNRLNTSGTKNYRITQSGVYRIRYDITIGGVTTTRYSGNFTITV
jgi:hypothetical protein